MPNSGALWRIPRVGPRAAEPCPALLRALGFERVVVYRPRRKRRSRTLGGADVVLVFSTQHRLRSDGTLILRSPAPGSGASIIPRYATIDRSAGYVVVPPTAGRGRVLLRVEESVRNRSSTWLAENFAKEFIKAYKQANGLK